MMKNGDVDAAGVYSCAQRPCAQRRCPVYWSHTEKSQSWYARPAARGTVLQAITLEALVRSAQGRRIHRQKTLPRSHIATP